MVFSCFSMSVFPLNNDIFNFASKTGLSGMRAGKKTKDEDVIDDDDDDDVDDDWDDDEWNDDEELDEEEWEEESWHEEVIKAQKIC